MVEFSKDSCYVCLSKQQALHEHHIWPQARGGRDKATVMLCPSCHQSIHNSATARLANKNHMLALHHLSLDGQRRGLALANAIVRIFATDPEFKNPNPLLAVKLNDPKLLMAAHILKRSKGFSSLEALFNSILTEVAKKYGLIQ